ncbi:synaptic vesicle membrane protein VAT-1 homolog isoform X2 [Nematostella vectensis]|uniref:synaptic vesicle membrane protein VAT-1 homolog isoform X2 n=1 Tax=Nematostella vectensis TaxID=45351 RepID=UPI0013906CDC|nr:synaptic vesicle membrane protein VAT-1 homolog isoform X2 [Nematostella vectensis]
MAETEPKDTSEGTQTETKDEAEPVTEQPPKEVQPELHSMRSVVLTGHGGNNKIKVEKYARPKPMQGQVVVKVHACGVTFADLLQRQGHFPLAPKPPYVCGFECSGVVEELGEEVTGIDVGARVICLAPYGMWTEYACVDAKMCYVMPEAMTFEEGAAIPITYLTAHLILFHLGNLGLRKSVLVHMAAGGVGTAVTQICKSVEGVTVFGTASENKHEAIQAQGVTHPIDYRKEDYVKKVREISPDGVDLVLDPLGGSETKRCYDLLKPMGALIHYGNAAENKGMFKWFSGASFQPSKMMSDNATVCGFSILRLFNQHELLNTTMGEVMKLYNEGFVKPVIDSVLALEEAGKAMQKMHDRKNIGKMVLSPMKEPEPEPEPVEPPKDKHKKKGKKGSDEEGEGEGKEEEEQKPEEADGGKEEGASGEEKKEEEVTKSDEKKKDEDSKPEEAKPEEPKEDEKSKPEETKAEEEAKPEAPKAEEEAKPGETKVEEEAKPDSSEVDSKM